MSAKHVKEGYVKYWVLTLGIDKTWRETQSISPFTPYYSKPSVCISGVIYQFVISDNEYAIAAFDVKSEKSKLSAFWKAIELVYHYELIEVKGKLAVIDSKRWLFRYVHLWISEQTSRKEWERHIIFFPSIWNNRELPASISSGTSVDGEIIFVVNLKSCALCLCYDVITKIWTNVKIKGLPTETYIKGIYSYVETLVM
uniref:F-box protein n=1 Tax=Solanum tuberosum TaxID=4113 RepID=M1E0G5_SOLTU